MRFKNKDISLSVKKNKANNQQMVFIPRKIFGEVKYVKIIPIKRKR